MFLEISQNSQENTCGSFFFNKAAGLRPANLLKKDSGIGVFQQSLGSFQEHLFCTTPLGDDRFCGLFGQLPSDCPLKNRMSMLHRMLFESKAALESLQTVS